MLTIIAILAGMLLTALGKAKNNAQGILCMRNTKQLILAVNMDAGENREEFPMVTHGGWAHSGAVINVASASAERPKVAGWLTWDIIIHNANRIYLADIRYADDWGWLLDRTSFSSTAVR